MTRPCMPNTDFNSSYIDHVADLERRLGADAGLREAVGGDFVAIGKLEYYLLRSLGLGDGQLVVDVGCGCGRLGCQLAPFPGIRYIGSDVVPRLLAYAEQLCSRPDWSFVHVGGTTIACPDSSAQFVCFFSVFTHLLHEDSYRYFREARRCLKPGGKLVMSFLEFRAPTHWPFFASSDDNPKPDRHLDQFIERDAIHAWAGHSDLDVVSIRSGDTLHIPIPEEIVFDSGTRMGSLATIGQSVAILERRP